jgi:hypothetical protein
MADAAAFDADENLAGPGLRVRDLRKKERVLLDGAGLC